MGELDSEQRHLDETCAAFDVALAALTGRGGYRGSDDFANEALEAMRRERVRQYTDASGPLYFGRIDRTDGDTLYVGRHAIWSAGNALLAVNWRAPAAEPFYTATERAPHGVRRRRRLDIEDRTVLGFVDEPLDTVGRFDVSELEVSYRVPHEFLQIAGALLPPGAPSPRGVREAPFPARALHTEDLGAAAAAEARSLSAVVDGSVGVIAPLEHMHEIRAALGDFDDATQASLGAGINLLDLHVAKGLEFDAIVVVEPAAILRERRAMAVIHREPLPEPLAAALAT